MRAPSGERPPKEAADEGTEDDRTGSWVEVRGSDEEVLYRRRIPQIAPEDAEVHDGGEDGTFRRVPRGEPSGIVNVVVPDIAGAETAVVRARRPVGGKGRGDEPTDHASVSFDRLDLADDTDDTDGTDDAGDDDGDTGPRSAGGR